MRMRTIPRKTEPLVSKAQNEISVYHCFLPGWPWEQLHKKERQITYKHEISYNFKYDQKKRKSDRKNSYSNYDLKKDYYLEYIKKGLIHQVQNTDSVANCVKDN